MFVVALMAYVDMRWASSNAAVRIRKIKPLD